MRPIIKMFAILDFNLEEDNEGEEEEVPDLASVGNIDTEDMAEMMKINREMLDIKELSQDDIDSLLNIDSFYPTNTNMSGVSARASNEGYPKAPEGFTITEKAPTRVIVRAFSVIMRPNIEQMSTFVYIYLCDLLDSFFR